MPQTYYIVVRLTDGTKYMNSYKRLGFDRALRLCNEARELGAIYAVAFEPDGSMMTAVTPWAHEFCTMSSDDCITEATAFRELSLSLGEVTK